MKVRNIIIGSIVAVGATAVAVKKLVIDTELNSKIKENGKKTVDSVKELSKSVGEAAKNTAKNVAYEAKSIKDEVAEKIKEKETEINNKAAERKEVIKEAEKLKTASEDNSETNSSKDVEDENILGGQ